MTGWSGGAGLTFADKPGSADHTTYLSVKRLFPAISHDGGNLLMADGDMSYSRAI